MRNTPAGLIGEDQLQETLVEACQAVGRRVFHASDSRKQVRTTRGYELVGDELAAGYPDLTVAPLPGGWDAIWAELKGPKGRLEEQQVEWLDDLPPHRGFVWRSDDLDEAVGIIQAGHPQAECRTCWTCSREEIIRRIGVRRKREGRGSTGVPAGRAGPARGGRR